jgi:hypothetical protein
MQQVMKTVLTRAPLVPAVLLAFGSCRPAEAGQRARDSASVASPASVPARVDSVLPVDESLRRFRADIAEAPTALTGGSTSREALVRSFVQALERSDTLALASLVLTRAEFAYLYYPSSPLAAPPYQLPPSLMWFQLQENNRKAGAALLAKRGGMHLEYVGHDCAASERQGANTIWSRCRVLRRSSNGGERSERLFGTILERNGRYEFVGLSNELR